MKYLRHFSTAHTSELMEGIITEFGYEGYGRYWKLLEHLALKYDGETTIFRVHKKNVRAWLGFRSNLKMSTYLLAIGYTSRLKIKELKDHFEFNSRILFELQDKDSKYNRKRVAKKSQTTSTDVDIDVDVNTDVDIKENILSFSDTQTHPVKSKISYEEVACLWDKYFPSRHAPFQLSASHRNDFLISIGFLKDLKQWDELFKKAASLDWYTSQGWFNILWLLKHENIVKIQHTENSTTDKPSIKKINLSLIKSILARGYKSVKEIDSSFGLNDEQRDFLINSGGLVAMGSMNDFQLKDLIKEAQ
tara:strand:+ start:7139 stop:8053 length:915 start_codon:yes stop_codon:yes gene_type:complete